MLVVLKYGGNAMAAAGPDPVLDDVAALVAAGDSVVIVHGGGPQIDAALAERGIAEPRVAGLRVTGAAARDVVEAVLCGSVNKALVRALVGRGVRAVGISGQDGGLVSAPRIGVIDGTDLGFVGDDPQVNPALLSVLLNGGFVPVVAPLALDPMSRAALNVNADTVAGAIAGALAADVYVVITNVAGVRRDLNDPASVLDRITLAQARGFLADGTFSGGMIPKARAAIAAVEAGAKRALIGSGVREALAGSATAVVP
ncbi:MAG: acetylglutamate kinase [Candidatus Velthaea sp.]|jgi:acetylglutamate kinase